MTANEPDPPPPPSASQSRRASLATSVVTSPKDSTLAGAGSPVAHKQRSLPPPLGPRNPTSPGTSRRTSYSIPAATSLASAAASASEQQSKFQVVVEPARLLSGAGSSTATPSMGQPSSGLASLMETDAADATDTPTIESSNSSGPLPTAAPALAMDGKVEGSLSLHEEPLPEYRSPEVVVELIEDTWESGLPPGVLAEHLGEDDSGWSKPDDMDVDVDRGLPPPYIPDRPQIGGGTMVGRWLEKLHPHELYRPVINDIPKPSLPKTPKSPPVGPTADAPDTVPGEASTSAAPPAPEYPSLTVDQVYDALPGGKEKHNDWYFCPTCWGWFHVLKGDFTQPNVPPMVEWEENMSFDTEENRVATRQERLKEMSQYSELISARATGGHNKDIHFHAFDHLIPTVTKEWRIDRVEVEGYVDKFIHLELGEIPEQYTTYRRPTGEPKLYASCTSDHWVFVDNGPIPGQLPPTLVTDFTNEKVANPGPGQDGPSSAILAWHILQNALFKGNRGFVKMSNSTFQNKIGASLTSSHLMYQLGLACDEVEGEGLRVGPFTQNDQISAEAAQQMDRYMARVWVEVNILLQLYRSRHPASPNRSIGKKTDDFDFVNGKILQNELTDWLGANSIPTLSLKFESRPFLQHLHALGCTDSDVVETVSKAYDLQIADDAENVPLYFQALDKLSRAHVPGVEQLQIKVATERSLDRFTIDDLDDAYVRLGIDQAHCQSIDVPRDEMPYYYILDQHRRAMEATSDPSARSEISEALRIIGRERNNPLMIQIARGGGVYLSLDQAYQEFNLTRDGAIDDELLILQYETWISDRPSRTDHYRMALSIIANAPGEERPVLQAFLEGKDISEFQPPVRRDIPAGLKNIGNTCYLNSVLQFLYAIKPVRDFVMTFENNIESVPQGNESEKEREKRIKILSSQRFVALLRELFTEMYTTSAKAVVPKEELARLAILPIDLVGERTDSLPVAPKSHVTIDSLPLLVSPDSSTIASGAATAADSRTCSPLSTPAYGSPVSASSIRPSILGKRSSHDRESNFGGSEEHLRRLAESSERDLIELDNDEKEENPPSVARADSELPSTDLAQLDITSPVTEVRTSTTTLPASETTPGPFPAPTGPPPLPPRRNPSTALVAAEKFRLQQDAAEILINVLSQLEYAVEPLDHDNASEGTGPTTNLIASLFSSKFRQQMILQSKDGSVTESHAPVESVFVHPIIGVEEDGKDLNDCLAELYLGGAEIEYDGKKGFKMDLIDELPPMLYIQMRRSQYDYAKQRQTKTNTHVPFGRTLVMDRFLASADHDKRERSIVLTRDIMRMRARRHELKNHKPMSISDTFMFVRAALADESTSNALDLGRDSAADLRALANDLSSDILEALETQSRETDSEVAQLERKLPLAKKELEDLWEDEDKVQYELVSVFVHGGTGTGGHYWTYQANLPNDGNEFFYYSDDTVKEVGPEEVFADKSAKGVSPALLCYVRKGRDLVDTLHREAESESAGPAGDEEMDETMVVAAIGAATQAGASGGDGNGNSKGAIDVRGSPKTGPIALS